MQSSFSLRIVAMSILACMAVPAMAQPDSAAIHKDIARKGMQIKALQLGPTSIPVAGEWWQQVSFLQETGTPEHILQVQGNAVYTVARPDTYVFDRFDWATSQYQNLPQVTNEELLETIYDDPSAFFGSYYHRTVHVHEGPELLPSPYIKWYSIRSVEVQLRTLFTYIANDTDTETREQVFALRLYRDAPGKPWKRFDALPVEHPVNRIVKTDRYTKVQIIKMYDHTIARKLPKYWKD